MNSKVQCETLQSLCQFAALKIQHKGLNNQAVQISVTVPEMTFVDLKKDSPVSLKSLVSIQNQIIETPGSQQELFFVPKERDGLQTLDPEFLLPSSEVPGTEVVGQSHQSQK